MRALLLRPAELMFISYLFLNLELGAVGDPCVTEGRIVFLCCLERSGLCLVPFTC